MSAMKRRLSWLLALPLALIGSQAGHELGYRLAVPSPHERAHLLERTGHAYLEYAPLAVGAALAVLAVGFLWLVARLARGDAGAARMPVALALLLPPLVFVCQEHVERYLHHHAVPWETLVQPAVLAGLVVQLPAALFAAFLTHPLTRLAERVARSLAPPPATRPAERALWPQVAAETPRLPVLALGYAGRGPPSSS
jgi:hypothetical protein